MHFPFSTFKRISFNSLVLLLLLSSCVPARKAIFFNGMAEGKEAIDLAAQEAAKRVYPGDRIAVTIVIEHPDMVILNQGLMAAGGNMQMMGQVGGGFGYLVDKDGNIEIMKLGLIPVNGKTPVEIAEDIKDRVAVQYKDPQVYCTLSGRVLFLGSGSAAGGAGGVVPIMNDRLTILEALSLRGIGDPTAVRDRVWIIRERGEEREIGTIDINSKDVFKSPYYFLRNNDIIYMEPNRMNTFLSINSPVRNFIFTAFTTLSLTLSIIALIR